MPGRQQGPEAMEHRRLVIARCRWFGLPAMQRRADAHRSRLGPRFGIERTLGADTCGDRGDRVRESGLEGISDRLEVAPTVGTAGRVQAGVMPLESEPPRLPVALPE